jgi:hypothetical protein
VPLVVQVGVQHQRDIIRGAPCLGQGFLSRTHRRLGGHLVAVIVGHRGHLALSRGLRITMTEAHASSTGMSGGSPVLR